MQKYKILNKVKRYKGSLAKLSFTDIKIKTILICSFLIIGVIPLLAVGYFTYHESRNTVEQKVGFYSLIIFPWSDQELPD